MLNARLNPKMHISSGPFKILLTFFFHYWWNEKKMNLKETIEQFNGL